MNEFLSALGGSALTLIVTAIVGFLAWQSVYGAAKQQIEAAKKIALDEIKSARDISQAQLLLHLDERFDQHKDVHLCLRPGGAWANKADGPTKSEEWSKVEAYMGLFERIYVMIDNELIKPEIINDLYGYRVHNIVVNTTIREAKLVKEKASWKKFIALCDILNIKIPS